jgi:hypothetical protein
MVAKRSDSVPIPRAFAAALLAVTLLVLLAAACGGSSSSSKSAPVDASLPADAAPDVDSSTATDAGDPADDAACPNLPAATLVAPSSAQLVIQGEPGATLGIYDPSLVYPAGASGGVLSYSAVSDDDVHTRVAVSTDLGATFQYVADANQVAPVTVTTTDPSFCDAGACSVEGVLWHEVSSVVADPTDTAAPYKLFVHSYVSVDGGAVLRRDWGYIGMQTATTPSTWSAEQTLLGWSSDATISSTGAAQILTDLPELSDCVAFTEPGAYVGPLGLDLALSCAYSPTPDVVKIRVVLLRSTDHAHTFSFVSTLLSADDFGCIEGTVPQVLGPDLFSVAGAEYLVVSPTGTVSNTDAGGYLGCVTLPITDPTTGTIARAANGAPSAASWVEAADGRFTGPCTYAEGATALGQIVPMQFTDQALPWFRILRTSVAEP